FNGRTSAFQADGAGSIPVSRSIAGVSLDPRCQGTTHAHVAQSVEHLLGKEEVDGSIPFVSTTFGPLHLARPSFHQFNRDTQSWPRVSSSAPSPSWTWARSVTWTTARRR